jgi:cell division protein FtsW
MILSVSRYTAKLEEEREAMAEAAAQIGEPIEGMEEGEQEEAPVSEAQTAFEPGMKEANDDTLME